MTSRLDRLFILLESGSSAVTRKAAAKQIGEVQRLHPHELHNLLNRLIAYLHNNNWDTRIAASQAVQAILENVPQWNPKGVSIKREESESSLKSENSARLTFETFDLQQILQKGAHLMGSEGSEFDLQEDDSMDSSEILIKQRAALNEKLGLNAASKLGISIDELVTLDDVKFSRSISKNTQEKPQQNPTLLAVQDILNSSSSSMSNREKNRAKRKARQNQMSSSMKSSSTSPSLSRSNSTTDLNEPERKKVKTEVNGKFYSSPNDVCPDATGSWGTAVEWPLESFCAKLYLDLFSPRWEIRHGSATALRELLKSHIDGAGKSANMTRDEMQMAHDSFLEDCALRLLCVLALDRFGDFVSDQVVAPVRETCAQVLGTVLKQMNIDKVRNTIDILLKFIKQKDWEVRHGGLLGIKYMLVVREDLVQKFLPSIIGDVLTGLLDSVDDVGAVAASALIPIAPHLAKLLSPKQVSCIVKMLWDLLLDQDELASACNSFMGLLAAILSLPDASTWIEMEPMNLLIPRLWPFLSHSTSSVRRSTLQTLLKLTDTNNVRIKPELSAAASTSLSCQFKSPLLANLNGNGSNLVLNFGVSEWPSQLLQEALRHIYQRILVEHIEDIQNLVEEVWKNLVNNADISALLHAACPYVSCWMCLAMQPTRLAFDQNLIIHAKPPQNKDRKARQFDLIDVGERVQQKYFLGGTETIPQETREKNVMRARYKACRMIGLLSKYLVIPAPGAIYTAETESPINCYTKVLLGYLQSRSSLQRMISSLVVTFWAEMDENIIPGPLQLQDRLKTSLSEQVYYDEVGVSFTRLLQESRDFLATLKQYKVPINDFDNCNVFTLDQIRTLATTMTDNLKEKYSLKTKIAELLEERRKGLFSSYNLTNIEQTNLNISTQASLASAVVRLQTLPEKLNPVVKPLMESIKKEECEILQKLSADCLTHLMAQVIQRNPSPNGKILNNLCTLLKSDEDFTPKINFPDKTLGFFSPTNESPVNAYYGIITLDNQQRAKEGLNGTPATPITRGPGRPSAIDLSADDFGDADDPSRKNNRIQRIGATFAIQSMCRYFKDGLPIQVPAIWDLMFTQILKVDDNFVEQWSIQIISADETNGFMLSLQLIEVTAPSLDEKLHPYLFQLLPKFCVLLKHPFKAIRHMTSRCLATLSLIDPSKVMTVIIRNVTPMLAMIENAVNREGAAEAISCIVNKLQFQIVPYVVLLVVPLLGRMSDPDQSVRMISTHCFATLIQLMPLDGLTPDIKTELTDDLKSRKLKDKEFLEYLFSPKTIPDFKVPVPINAELRSYQQAGVNWLWFLNKYKLHGILCDDMGLGKTLQAICILAGDHYQRQMEKEAMLPSIVICPPTLTGHWVYEVNKFLPEKLLKPLHYYGLPVERERLRSKVKGHNLVIASYDIVRKDIDFFKSIHWNYCVLDEGHIIKNGKTKSSKAIKQLIANHRLILSGTPIQNNVLELWSLFDFLMPGFLGTEKQFMVRFSRPILASRDPKSSPKEQEAGALAMEALHRQVLPFLLRRVKEDVLTDLPPKITQDLLCELSPLQERLYEDFSRTHFNNGIKECLESIDKDTMNKKTHVFQALRYLQNVCNHPKLVLKPTHPEYQSILTDLRRTNTSLDEICHSAKLPALKQLLLDCGIGTNEDMSINQHRALIFCQLKAMLDIIENDLLKKHLPSVTYLRLDGGVQASNRHEIVTKFNNDPSIDVLLLTTQVGGLGLNLTGADTVIFVEHDWNPMKDLQAMDRAHRIGQKKVVNVYRLITRKSLEEKIMGLQKFKILTANTVVSVDNQTMETMGTDQLLDLFNLSEEDDNNRKQQNKSGNPSMKNVLENLPELWDNQSYEEEYDISTFIKSMGTKN